MARIGNILTDWLAWTDAEHRQAGAAPRSRTFPGGGAAGYSRGSLHPHRLGSLEAGAPRPGWRAVRTKTPSLRIMPPVTSPPSGLTRYCQVWMAGDRGGTNDVRQCPGGGGDDMRALTLLWQALNRPAAEGVIKTTLGGPPG